MCLTRWDLRRVRLGGGPKATKATASTSWRATIPAALAGMTAPKNTFTARRAKAEAALEPEHRHDVPGRGGEHQALCAMVQDTGMAAVGVGKRIRGLT